MGSTPAVANTAVTGTKGIPVCLSVFASRRVRVYVRVRVDDATKSYWPKMALDAAWGGLASDAVSVRTRGKGDEGSAPLAEFIERAKGLVEAKGAGL